MGDSLQVGSAQFVRCEARVNFLSLLRRRCALQTSRRLAFVDESATAGNSFDDFNVIYWAT
jgi:hypothetical protein